MDNFHSMQDWLSHCACSKSICISRCTISIYFAKKKKKCFFYFTHPLLQNTHINLSILHIYSIKYSFLTQYLATINDQTKKKESSGDHQPTHQNLKTTNQNHQKPLIKTIKIHWSKSQNHQTKKKDSNDDWREQCRVRWSAMAWLWRDLREQRSSEPSKPTDQNPKTIKQRKKIATTIDESSSDRCEQQWSTWATTSEVIGGGTVVARLESAAKISGGKKSMRWESNQREKERVRCREKKK